mmetsp:Transcript_21605/g.36809  ORF Transcript_21605/g.36809 Transcript_21605/m.36809 type:complete len:188 (-) Transcript_21605:60-623(-)
MRTGVKADEKKTTSSKPTAAGAKASSSTTITSLKSVVQVPPAKPSAVSGGKVGTAGSKASPAKTLVKKVTGSTQARPGKHDTAAPANIIPEVPELSEEERHTKTQEALARAHEDCAGARAQAWQAQLEMERRKEADRRKKAELEARRKKEEIALRKAALEVAYDGEEQELGQLLQQAREKGLKDVVR